MVGHARAANARHSGGVLWLGGPDSPAGRLTLAACGAEGKPFLVVQPDRRSPADVVAWVDVFEIEVADFGLPLRNPLAVAADEGVATVRSL